MESTGGSLQDQQVNFAFQNQFYLSIFRFSIAINNEFAGDFWNSFKTRIVYKFLPTLLTSTKILHRYTNVFLYLTKPRPITKILLKIVVNVVMKIATKNVPRG